MAVKTIKERLNTTEIRTGLSAAANGAEPEPGGNMELVTITPEMAADWLARPSRNRTMNANLVRQYAAAMQRGEWSVTGDTIKRNRHDRLVDGQHRLAAVVMSGVAIRSYVVHGIEPDAFDDMDTGRRRAFADVLKMHGYANASSLGGAVLLVINYDWYGDFTLTSTRIQPSRRQMLAFIREHPGIEDAVRWSNRTSGLRAVYGSRSTASALIYILTAIDPDGAEAFFSALGTGEELDGTSPILHLRKRLLENRISTTKLPVNEVAALTIKAWNSYRSGGPMEVLRWRGGGSNPEAFPTIA